MTERAPTGANVVGARRRGSPARRRRLPGRGGEERRSEPFLEISAHVGLASRAVVPPREPARRPGGVPRPPGDDRTRARRGRGAGGRRRLRPGRTAAGRRRAVRPGAAPARRRGRADRDDLRKPRLAPAGSASAPGSSSAPGSICVPTRPAAPRPVVLADDHGDVAFYGLPYLEPALVRDEFRTQDGRPRGGTGRGDGARTGRPRHARAGHPVRRPRARLRRRRRRPATANGTSPSAGSPPSPPGSSTASTTSALGHLHGCQTITERVRYSGSPLAVLLLRDRGTARPCGSSTSTPTARSTAERVDCPVPRPLARLRGTLEDLLADPALARHEESLGRGDPHRPGPARRAHGPARRALPAHPQPGLRARADRRGPARLVRAAAARPQRPADRRGLRGPRARRDRARRARAGRAARRVRRRTRRGDAVREVAG